MPLFKFIPVSKGIEVLIWKIEESENELRKGIVFSKLCKKRLAHMKSEMHRRGFLSVRHLLKKARYSPEDLYYDAAGKPHLRDGKNISITHSFNFSGIIISDTVEVGIDVEKQRDKIIKIAHKFTFLQEYRTIANSEALIRKLTIVWGAKESLYKIYATFGLLFLEHILVSDFYLEDKQTKASISYRGKVSSYNIDFLEFEGFTCVYALAVS